MGQFTLKKRKGESILSGENLSEIFTPWRGEKEHWLFIVPHDDDVIIGGGLLIQKAIKEGIPVTVVITTDGSMGYCLESQRDTIKDIRREETLKGLNILGIKDVKWLDFPDCSTSSFIGRRAAGEGDPCIIDGCTGMENAFTYELRRVKPSRVFVPAGSDLNMDHKNVYNELLMSVFHAAGTIWPNLGNPLEFIPSVYEMAVYCDFDENPDIKIEADSESFNKKLDSILAFQSQTQIQMLVDNLRESGPVEYFRDIVFNLYSPETYRDLF